MRGVRLLELRRRDVREIAAPPRVFDADRPVLPVGLDLQAGQLRDDAVAHERADAHRAVVRARHRVAHARIQTPERDLCGDRDHALQLRGLAEQREQAVLLAAGRSHLIHHAARRADHEVLDHLAQQRHVARVEREVEGGGHRLHRRHFERGGRAHALAARHARSDQDARALSKRRRARASAPARRRPHTRPSGARGRGGSTRARPRSSGGRRRRGPRAASRTSSSRPGSSDRLTIAERPLGVALQGDERGLVDRQLQHERAGVVGDAAHHVEAARRARDEDVRARRRTARALPAQDAASSAFSSPTKSETSARSCVVPWAMRYMATQPRSVSSNRPRPPSAARSSGSMTARSCSLA